MELPNIGQQCSEEQCKQLDFLPLQCTICKRIFCTEHFSKHSLECSILKHKNETTAESDKTIYVCSEQTCNSRSFIELLCKNCNKHFCVVHRHLNDCGENNLEVVSAKLEKYSKPINDFNAAKLLVNKQLDKSIQEAKRNPKKQQMANKIQLMRIKNKALGPNNIPVTERIYFNVQHPKSVNVKISPMFVSKNWTLGRAIDALANECKVVNKNNQGNARKLKLFNKISGKMVSTDTSKRLEELLLEGVIADGEEVMLEYVDDCVNLMDS